MSSSSFKEVINNLIQTINGKFIGNFPLIRNETSTITTDLKHNIKSNYNDYKKLELLEQYKINPLPIQIKFVIESQEIFKSILLKDNFDISFDFYCNENYDHLEINKRLKEYKKSGEDYNLHYKVLEFYLYNILKICIYEIYKLYNDINTNIVEELYRQTKEIEYYYEYYTWCSYKFNISFDIFRTIMEGYKGFFNENNNNPTAYRMYKILKILFFNLKFILKLFFYDINLDSIYLFKDVPHNFLNIFDIQQEFHDLPFKKMDKLYIGPNPFNDIRILNIQDTTYKQLFELRLSTLNLFPLKYSQNTNSQKGGGLLPSMNKQPADDKIYQLMSFNIFECKGYTFENQNSLQVGSQNKAISKFIKERNVDILCIQENNNLEIDKYNRPMKKNDPNCNGGTEIYINKKIPNSKNQVTCIRDQTEVYPDYAYAVVMTIHNVTIATLYIKGDKFIADYLERNKNYDKIVDSLSNFKRMIIRNLLEELVVKHNPDIICGDFNSVYSDEKEILEDFLENQYNYILSHLRGKKQKKFTEELTENEKEIIKTQNLIPFEYLEKNEYTYAKPTNEIVSTSIQYLTNVDLVWYKENKIINNGCEVITENVTFEDGKSYLSNHYPVLFKFKINNSNAQPQIQTLDLKKKKKKADNAAAADKAAAEKEATKIGTDKTALQASKVANAAVNAKAEELRRAVKDSANKEQIKNLQDQLFYLQNEAKKAMIIMPGMDMDAARAKTAELMAQEKEKAKKEAEEKEAMDAARAKLAEEMGTNEEARAEDAAAASRKRIQNRMGWFKPNAEDEAVATEAEATDKLDLEAAMKGVAKLARNTREGMDLAQPQPLTQQQDVEFDKTIEKLKKIKKEPCLFRFDKDKNSLNETYEDYFDHQFDYLFKRHTMKYYVIYESL